MLIWESRQKGKPPIIIQFIYEEETEKYLVRVKRGKYVEEEYFVPSFKPVDGFMNIKDLEKAVKIANIKHRILKKIKIDT